MRSTLFLIALSSAMLCSFCVYGQDVPAQQGGNVVKLSIGEMFSLADANNSSIKAHSTATLEALEGVKVAKNAYLQNIDISVSASYNGDGTVWDRDFTDIMSAEIPSFGNSFAVEVSQVLYTGGAIKHSIQMSSLASQMAQLNSQKNRSEIHFLIAGNYLELCKICNHQQVLASHIGQVTKVLEQMRVRAREGAALQNDVTRFELLLQNLEYNKVKLDNAREIINTQLNIALGLDEGTVIEPSEICIDSLQDNGDWEQQALNSAYGIRMAGTATRMSQEKLQITKSERLPKIAVYATNSLNGPVTFEIPVLDKNFNYWGFGIGLKYNLGNLYKTGKKIRQEKLAVTRAAQQEQVATEGILLGVKAAQISYREAYVLLKTKEKSVELAQENYNLVNYRYNNGLALVTDLLDASSQSLDARLQEVNARINILYNYYKLQYLSGIL